MDEPDPIFWEEAISRSTFTGRGSGIPRPQGITFNLIQESACTRR